MLILFIVRVIISLFIYLFVKFIDKNLNPKLKTVIIVLSWILTFVFGFLIYDSIQEPLRFDRLKEKRFQVAVNKMLDLKKAQMAYKLIKGQYTDNMDSLIKFIETEEFVIEERKDTSVADVAKNRAFGLSNDAGYYKNEVIIREIGRVKVKDSLFKNSDRYKKLNVVKIEELEKEIPIKMEIGLLEKGDIKTPLFKASIEKKHLLADQESYLVTKENQTVSVDGINGSEIILGSLEEVSMAGNWPKKYGKNE